MTMTTHTRQTKAKNYTLIYNITKNLNTSEPQMSVTEYGISCVAFHADGTISSAAEVLYISPIYHKVCTILNILAKHKVFPNHLKDIISDLIEETPWEDNFVNYPESA